MSTQASTRFVEGAETVSAETPLSSSAGPADDFGFDRAQKQVVMAGIHRRGDLLVAKCILAHGLVALALAFFNNTWLTTGVVTACAIGVFTLSRSLLPGSFLTRCLAGVSLQTFVALHIYQLHGLDEMHFFFFTSFTLLIVYQDWKCLWPGAIAIIIQHTLLAALHRHGVRLYFFDQSDVGITKLFFYFSIAVVHVCICGYWAYLLRCQTLGSAAQNARLNERNEALHAAEARLQRMIANTPGMVYQYVLRPDGSSYLPFVSESCREIFGVPPEYFYAHPEYVVETIHPDDLAFFHASVAAAIPTSLPWRWEGRLRLDGKEHVRWIEIVARPERQTSGEILCDGLIIDVTARKCAERALRASEERFRNAIFHAPFPIMLHAEGGQVLDINHSWTVLTGYTAQDLPTIDAWTHKAYPHHHGEMLELINKQYQLETFIEAGEFGVTTASGEERIWDFSAAPLGRLPDGRRMVITNARDVTERKRQERVLRKTKEEAERANAAKSEFLSRMSHELRTPLSAILGFGQLLELSNLDEQDILSVHHILKGGRHLLGLVDEVLDLARVEAGKLALEPSAVSFDKLSRECTGFVARMAQARGIICTVEACSACQAPVWADEQRLRQVLLNLLSNAIKYNREGGQVCLSCEQTPTGDVRLKVRDTGPGISPEGLARLFVPFERLDQEFGEVEGSGLGLAVSRRLAEAMGGRVGAESEVDHGSTFWVELPIAENMVPAQVEDAKQISLPTMDPEEPAPASVLYIEDNLSNLQVVGTLIKRLRPHWRFLSAREGRSGLQQACEHLPGVILLDLQLPGMKGDVVLTELRADLSTCGIPVLLLTADATAHSREKLLALGADDYLSKPFNVPELLHKLDTLLLRVHG